MFKKYFRAQQITSLGGGHTSLDVDVVAARDIYPGIWESIDDDITGMNIAI